MHAPHTSLRLIAALLAMALVSSCAYAPRVAEENDEVLTIRHDYMRTHPDGPFNDFIRRGEVVTGMTYLEVLASWGCPRARLRVPEHDLEYWRYVTRDDISGDWIQYTFVFEEDALSEWEMTRHTSLGRAMAEIERNDPAAYPVLDVKGLAPRTVKR